MQRTTLLIMFKIFNLLLERLKTEDLRKKEMLLRFRNCMWTQPYIVSPLEYLFYLTLLDFSIFVKIFSTGLQLKIYFYQNTSLRPCYFQLINTLRFNASVPFFSNLTMKRNFVCRGFFFQTQKPDFFKFCCKNRKLEPLNEFQFAW